MILTYHAKQRMTERDITLQDLRYALACARPERHHVYRIYRMGPRELRRLDSRFHRRLRGLCVVCTTCGVVITTYRRSVPGSVDSRPDQ